MEYDPFDFAKDHSEEFESMIKLALTLPGGEKITAPGGVANTSVSPILQFAVQTAFVFAILLSLFFLIYGGISFIISGGDKQKIVQARLKITYAIIGLIIVFLSFLIINSIGGLFGVSLLNFSLPSAVCTGASCITP